MLVLTHGRVYPEFVAPGSGAYARLRCDWIDAPRFFLHHFRTSWTPQLSSARPTVSAVQFDTIAPRLSTKPVKPLLDCPSSSDFSFPKHDSSTSVVPGSRSPCRTLDDSSVT